MRIALFLGIPLVLLSAACTYDNGDARRITDPSNDCPNNPAQPIQTWIDVDAKVEIHPGQGAGVFIEYAAGGHWTVRTACDTAAVKDAAPCGWDILFTPEDNRSIKNVVPYDLESSTDSVGVYPRDPRSYQLIAETGSDLDGVTFDTEPQSGLSVDAFLDGVCARPYFFWVGDGAAHTGSPSNPLQLIPTPE